MSENEAAVRGRVPPHNEDAERALLGAVLLDPERIPDVCEIVQSEDFFSRRHRLVFDACRELSERAAAVDILTISEFLRAHERLSEIGGSAFLATLTSTVASAAHALHHAGLVSQTAMLRRLIRESEGIIEEAFATPPDATDVGNLLDASEHRIFRISGERARSGAISIGAALDEAFRRIDATSGRRGLTGLPSGFYELDDMLCGLNAGELTVVAARPAMGKTAMMLNIMDHAATHPPEWLPHPPSILFFSLEMGRLSIVQRMLCARARVDAHKLRTGKIPREDYAELARAAGELQQARIFIDDTPGTSVMSIRSRARRVKHNHGLDMIVVDYLQLVSARAESRQHEISLISRCLKELARELEVPVIAISQLSRAVESREDKRPQLSDLRESGSIEQDADIVLMLYREEYYRPTEENRGKAEIICAKQRNGPTGSIRLQFFGNILRFENPQPSIAEPIL